MKTALILLLSIFLLPGESEAQDKTIFNLQETIQAETDASARFEVYSKKARDEGYEEYSKLFSALSKSESVQINQHKNELKKLDGPRVSTRIKDFDVNTTPENVEDAKQILSQMKTVRFEKYEHQAKIEGMAGTASLFEQNKDIAEKNGDLIKDVSKNPDEQIHEAYQVNKITGEIFQ